jgi:hypothetical protein
MSTLCVPAEPTGLEYGVLDPSPTKSVVENFIHSFGGISYDSDELVAAVFASGESAQECCSELTYLYRNLSVEVDGQWLAVYFS